MGVLESRVSRIVRLTESVVGEVVFEAVGNKPEGGLLPVRQNIWTPDVHHFLIKIWSKKRDFTPKWRYLDQNSY